MDPILDQRRSLWHCSCGFPFAAAPLAAAGRRGVRMTAFFAREAGDGVAAGQRITRCPRPHCRRRLAPIAWDRYRDLCAAGWGG
jgi:hypothetical protein